ncbi:unnamed protein product [Paramecium sonneborni]|uniref:Uncharacterized protein n=1 Tax=Paramecium sonneborni TaxID=65129 RepID=A0A8S1RW41_9CILI|nr:unnamed protein product [Paramecium sonneborni]
MEINDFIQQLHDSKYKGMKITLNEEPSFIQLQQLFRQLRKFYQYIYQLYILFIKIFLKGSSNTCHQCDTNCLTSLNDAKICISCVLVYFKDKYTECSNKCFTFVVPDTQFILCYVGRYFNINYCSPYPNTCTNCENSQNIHACSKSSYLNNNFFSVCSIKFQECVYSSTKFTNCYDGKYESVFQVMNFANYA